MLIEKNISLEEPEATFINNYASLGFQSEQELLAEALRLLRAKLEKANSLIESADFYADLYERDAETREWTQNGVANWPDHD